MACQEVGGVAFEELFCVPEKIVHSADVGRAGNEPEHRNARRPGSQRQTGCRRDSQTDRARGSLRHRRRPGSPSTPSRRFLHDAGAEAGVLARGNDQS